MEAATDTLLVTNVLRARDRAPLHFTTIGAIHGAFSLSAGLGYDLTAVNSGTQPALLAASNPSFDIGPLDRQEFARGLLRPIDPALLRLLSDQGWPDQVLLYLLVAEIRRRARRPDHRQRPAGAAGAGSGGAGRLRRRGGGGAAALRSVPGGGGWADRPRPAALQRLYQADPARPAADRAEATAPERLDMLKEPGVSLRRDGANWQLYRAVNQLVLCLPGAAGGARYTALALDNEPPQVSPITQEGDPCNADEVADHAIAAGRAAPAGLAWYLRSVEEVLQYLGAVQRREERGVAYRVAVPLPGGGTAMPRLFRLWQQPPPRPRIAADYRGTRWWVAEQDDAEDITLRVLALTTQLLNLQKSAGEIPSSGTLRLVR